MTDKFPPKNGLTIIILSADEERINGALMMAMAYAAVHPEESGHETEIFFHAPAVVFLNQYQDLLEEAHALGVKISACQSGLADHGISAGILPDFVTTTGPVQIMSDLGNKRLVML